MSDEEKEHPGMEVLRGMLRRMRWADQGGYVGYRGDGRWDFEAMALPQVTPDEVNLLFNLVGLVPDQIITLGDCETCKHAVNGHERGYKEPCGTCARPRMTNYLPTLAHLQRKKP